MTDTVKTEEFVHRDLLQQINDKAIQNECFTPDHVYIDMSLLKDIPLGVVYAHTLQGKTQAQFEATQAAVLAIIEPYENRRYHTVDEFLEPLGYNDEVIEELLRSGLSHDHIFMVAPTSRFFHTLIRHTVTNQNHSGPANKFVRKQIDNRHYSLESVPITYYFNTYPLRLSDRFMTDLGREFGESFGVNIKFMCKDPALFTEEDWDAWIKDIDCFYLDSMGRFTESDAMREHQGNLDFMGVYFFARKRHEKSVMETMRRYDFEQQVAVATSQIDMMCDFNWLQNNDTRLTEPPPRVEPVSYETHESGTTL